LLIITAIIIIIYSIFILFGYYNIFPKDLDNLGEYIFVAKNILYIGIFILFLGIFNFYRDLDIFAMLMSIIIVILFITKIHENIN
jgi:ABC-type transport system involved in multi-copper enzyme maturation permease subunit